MKIEYLKPTNFERILLKYGPPNPFSHLNCVKIAGELLGVELELPYDDLMRLYVHIRNNPTWIDDVISEKGINIVDDTPKPGDVVLVEGPVIFENNRSVDGLQLGFVHANGMIHYLTNHGIEIGLRGKIRKVARR